VSQVLQPYLEYKASGLPWLDEIPSHWDKKRAKYFFREVDERSNTGQEEMLSVSHITGVTPRKQKNVTMFQAESNVNHKLCHPGDLVINTMWAWMAALGVAKQTGIVSPSYAVYRPISSKAFIDGYIDHLLRIEPYAIEYLCSSTGIHSSRLRLYPEKFLEIPIIRPPYPEQIQMLAFLNFKDRLIRRYIRSKLHLIQLLEEQKQAIIHRAVTLGLDPSVPLKPSGVEWLGDIPEHWNVSRIKTEFQCLNYRRLPLSGTDRGAMTLRRYDYYGASGVIDKVDDYLFDDDLLLIAEDGANLVLRNLPLAIIARGKFWVNNHAHILKPKHGNLEYLAAVMESLNYVPWISGAAQPKLTQERLMSISICVPPRDEQNAIIQTVKTETSPLQAAVDHAKSEISLLREYRARLISDVVTGKLDVRGIDLPATPDTETPEEYTDLLEREEVMEDQELQEELPAEGN
jgi:type I restriction enzyme S subunit